MVVRVKGQQATRGRPKRGAPPSRAPWGTISRSQVVDAATALVAAGGYRQMTIRSLANSLGVAPMSLYRHVRDKGDLLEEVVDRLLSGAWRPRTSRANWRAWTEEAAEKFRAFLVSQPAALDVYLRHPVASPTALERMQAMTAVLREGGLDEGMAKRAYAAIHSYTLGFSAFQAARSEWAPDGEVSPLAKQLGSYATPKQFAEGLGYLLDGIDRTPKPAKPHHKR